MKLYSAVFAAKLCMVTHASDLSAQEQSTEAETTLQIYYLEIVTPNVADTIAALAAQHEVTFSDAIPELGFAQVAEFRSGGSIGIRAPLRPDEEPIVRPYMLVEDIADASEVARIAGAEFAMTTTEIPGHGRFAIYFLGGIQHGLWER